jgi:hypothetical protein
MTKLNEFDVVQNPALGSILIWSFVTEYYKTKDEQEGPTLPHIMMILPLLFNQHFVNSVYTKNRKGGLYNALNHDKSLFTGVQTRMESMSGLTLRSMHICFSAKIITPEKNGFELLPIRTKIPDYKHNESIHRMITASKRLGYWFATIDFKQLCALLKVRF